MQNRNSEVQNLKSEDFKDLVFKLNINLEKVHQELREERQKNLELGKTIIHLEKKLKTNQIPFLKLFKFLPPDELQQLITTACFAAIKSGMSDDDQVDTLAEVQHLFYDLTQYVVKNNLV